MTYAEIIERRVESRTATRAEWRALRRHRWRLGRGVNLDIMLMPVVVAADFQRAARAWLRSPPGLATRAMIAFSQRGAASSALRTLPSVMTDQEPRHPHDMQTIAPAIEGEVAMAEPVDGTWLPRLAVDAQVELGQLPAPELAKRFADLIYAMTLRHGPACTPRKLLAQYGEKAVSDDNWYERTGPELRRVLTAHGIDLQMLHSTDNDPED